MSKDFTTPHPEYQKHQNKDLQKYEYSEAREKDGSEEAREAEKDSFGRKDPPSWESQSFDLVDGTHSVFMGYLFWIFGWMGAHRFYYGKPVSGTIYFLTAGLFFIGWFVDLFLIPGMDKEADMRFRKGPFDHTVGFILLTFLGIFGVHRFYIGKWGTGLIYLVSAGLFGFGILYDFWTFNEQISVKNREHTIRAKKAL